VINSIQRGMVEKLDFQAIIDLVGDKLRELFASDTWASSGSTARPAPAASAVVYEHGQRLDLQPTTIEPDRPIQRRRCDRAPRLTRTRDEMAAMGLRIVPGTDTALSAVFRSGHERRRVPRVHLARELRARDAFDEGAVSLLSTVAASMGVALENARLFDETQRLFKQSEQRAPELAIINSIQRGMAEKLDFQTIIDLVGDKLRELFASDDMGIVWLDAEAAM
jgi:hypothetical protein